MGHPRLPGPGDKNPVGEDSAKFIFEKRRFSGLFCSQMTKKSVKFEDKNYRDFCDFRDPHDCGHFSKISGTGIRNILEKSPGI